MAAHDGCAPKVASRPRHEVAEIFRAHGEQYRRLHRLMPEQRVAMRAIEVCRTGVLGGHVDKCLDCGQETRPSYNSCGNRHCPKCQALAQARWLERQRSKILPVLYFHVVFTLASELRDLVLFNRGKLYDLLFWAASRTLLTFGQDKLDALLGVTAVLHTWTRDLRFHPHLHCIVTAGGLRLEDNQWIDNGSKYLFPVKALAKCFRGKFMAELTRLYERGELRMPRTLSTAKAFTRLCDKLFSKKWVVYARRPFAGPKRLFSYLGLYTHRIAISNHRILDVSENTVTIATRGDKTATMSAEQFIGRFLQHVLPKRFVKIRPYGLFASTNVKTRLVLAQKALESRQPSQMAESADDDPFVATYQELLRQLTGIDLTICPHCGSKRLLRIILPPTTHIQAPPARAPP